MTSNQIASSTHPSNHQHPISSHPIQPSLIYPLDSPSQLTLSCSKPRIFFTKKNAPHTLPPRLGNDTQILLPSDPPETHGHPPAHPALPTSPASPPQALTKGDACIRRRIRQGRVSGASRCGEPSASRTFLVSIPVVCWENRGLTTDRSGFLRSGSYIHKRLRANRG
jgi:hypothetical protein